MIFMTMYVLFNEETPSNIASLIDPQTRTLDFDHYFKANAHATAFTTGFA